jgi:uncharacterized protein (DUF58 family)
MRGLHAAVQRRVSLRLAAWLRQRQGLDALPLTLAARRIYIVPTRAGLGLAALLLAMLLAGLNYQNGLALLLCFTLSGLLLVTMLHCHQRLQGLRLDSLTLQPAFAGQAVHLTALLQLRSDEGAADLHGSLRANSHGFTAAQPIDEHRAQLTLSAAVTQRGVWPLPALRLQTRAPFGLFRTWTWIHLPLQTLVYPAAVGTLALPDGRRGGTGDSASATAGADEWLGLRDHREADGLRQVDWKRWARGGSMQVRQFSGASGGVRELDLSQVPLPSLEARLSQLTAWLLQADALGESYLLRLPGLQLDAAQGPAHLQRCLAALAVHGLPTDLSN